LVWALILALNAVGSVKVTEAVAVHALASVTVTVYVPANKEEFVAEVAALLQLYVYGEVPPEAVTVVDPVGSALHVKFV